MSKARHLHSILRGQRLLLLLDHASCPTVATAPSPVVTSRVSLRPVAAPGPADSCCARIHTRASSSFYRHHHTRSRIISSSSSSGHNTGGLAPPVSSSSCGRRSTGGAAASRSRPGLSRPLVSTSYSTSSRCLHTSRTCSSQVSHHADQQQQQQQQHHHHSDQPVARTTLRDKQGEHQHHHGGEEGARAARGTTSATEKEASIPYTHPGDKDVPGVVGLTDASAAPKETLGHGMHSMSRREAEWISELPWINPKTRMSYEPGQGPPIPPPSAVPPTPSTSASLANTLFPQPVFQQTRHNYIFSHGASGYAKNPNRPPILTPEEDQAYFSVQVGEDSYFRRHDALGVADGVGGWSGTSGANPALYSRKLMHYAFVELEKYDNIEEEAFYDYFNVNPVDILEKSYEQSTLDAKKEGLIGSSTACLAILRDDELRIANLGDCGISVIRNNEFIFRTEEQQHSFNYPYQLGTGSSDRPADAQVFTVKVKNGDIVVMGTDGIFDNLFDEDILEEVVRCIDGTDPNEGLSPYGTGLPAATATTSTTGKGMSSLWSGITSGAAKLASTSSSTIAAIAGKANVAASAAAAASAATSTTTNTTPTTSSSSDPSPPGSTEASSSPENSSQDLPSSARLTVGNEEDVDPYQMSADGGGLSPIAAAAVAAAESSALPLSATLYHLDPTKLSTGTTGVVAGTGGSGAGTYLSRSYERKIPEPSVISDALAKRAKSVAEDSRHHGSPFQSRAMQEGLYYQGGKRDDMSVLVAIIKVAEDSPDRR